MSRRASFTVSGIALGVGIVLAGSAVVLGPAAAVVGFLTISAGFRVLLHALAAR